MRWEEQGKTDWSYSRQMTPGVFKDALENASDAVGIWMAQGGHCYHNRAFAELFGIVGDELPVALYCDEQVGREVLRTTMAGEAWTGEVAMYARDRSVLSILLRAHTIKDKQGSVIGLVGIYTDITERRRVEEAMRVSEATYREIFNTVNDTIWVHDIDTFEFVDVNSKVTEMFGYSVSEALNLTVMDVSEGVFPFTEKRAIELLEKARDGEPQLFEWHTRHKDGHLFWTEVSLKRGTIAGRDCLLAIERDITERKRTEETLRRVHALESLGTVAGGIAHDFNNLLMGVFTNVELATMDLSADHPALEVLEDAYKALENARYLTTRLLTFAKGGMPVMETVDLRRRIGETVRFHLSGSNVAAKVDVPEDLWPVKADKGQIVQVISNLTVNAKEAMPAGGTFHVRARNVSDDASGVAPSLLRGDCLKLTMRDEGIGIHENIIGRIFDPYFTTKQIGSGLGLSIAHGIVSRHNGHLGVESQSGVGTTFTVLLPADTTKGLPQPTKRSAMPEALARGAKSVLLMDDEEIIRRTTARMLEKLRCTVEVAVDGRDAIDKFAASLDHGRPFDLIIMDLTVPGGMSGKDAVGGLLALDPSVKVIVSSGYSSDPVLAEPTRYGFSGAIVKPFSLQELSVTISRALEMA